MKKHLTLLSLEFEDVTLDSITADDLENLRRWKNANRLSFFHQAILSRADQANWFEGYLAREQDWMFVVRTRGQAVGCMGFRMIDSQADVYNVILGNPSMGKRGLMSKAMRLMCSYIAAEHTRDIGAKVLRSNLAQAWYRKLGFREHAAHDTYVDLELDLHRFVFCKFQSRGVSAL
ncbi:MAG: GNAT family N-acetyltransferase [Chloroflexi bacterium]|nr:GNAT family N-acetyltransferase [Chloroflexota bacterium]